MPGSFYGKSNMTGNYFINQTTDSTSIFGISHMVVDNNLNSYVVGYRNNNPPCAYTSSCKSGFVRKIDPTGAIVWNKYINYGGNQKGLKYLNIDIDVDSTSNAYISMMNASGYAGLMKLDNSGNKVWTKYMYGSCTYAGSVVESGPVVVDSSGNSYTSFFQNWTYGSGATANPSIIIVKHDSSGNFQTNRRFYFSCGFQGYPTLRLNPTGTSLYMLGTAKKGSSAYGFLSQHCISNLSMVNWSHFGSNITTNTKNIVFDSSGNIYTVIAGFVVKFNSSLTVLNATRYYAGKTCATYPACGGHSCITKDSSGNFYVTGQSSCYIKLNSCFSPVYKNAFICSGAGYFKGTLKDNSIFFSSYNRVSRFPTDGSRTGAYLISSSNSNSVYSIRTTSITGSANTGCAFFSQVNQSFGCTTGALTHGCGNGSGANTMITGCLSTTGNTSTINLNTYNSSYGSALFNSPGTYCWVAPSGVTSVSAVAIGPGGAGCNSTGYGGSGGGLGWKNNISVTPGTSYTVTVGTQTATYTCNKSNSYFINASTVMGAGGRSHGPSSAQVPGGIYVGDGGGQGGTNYAGGGGAGGYSGAGGIGAQTSVIGGNGSGGAGAGGGANSYAGGGGGGVSVFGQSSNGIAPLVSNNCGGGAGSYGVRGCSGTGGILYCSYNHTCYTAACGGRGGNYGGGGGYRVANGSSGYGGCGAVRIVWPGNVRTFPTTCVGAP
jgi:hypothetical protein